MNELIYLTFFAAIVLYIGIRERNKLDRNIKRIPTRILVNGIRGKSTVTRLLMGIIKEDKQRVAGKTTGTSPRLFYWDKEEEEPIIRSLQGPNISEQKVMVNKVARRGVNAFVTECMAVNPEYQNVFQERFVKANITVITNVMEDHLDVMGPTIDQIAEAFGRTIPHNGYVVIPPTSYHHYFAEIAESRGSEVVVADTDLIDEAYLTEFPFMMFAENAAIGLAVADILEIDRDVALRGMLNAPVDPGAMRVHAFGKETAPSFFFNGFAANDTTSTINIWNKIQDQDYPCEHNVVIMNCRDDRVGRTIQFSEEVLPQINADTLILTGKGVDSVVQAYESGKLPVNKLINLEKQSTEQILAKIRELPEKSSIYGIGNIHGGGQELADAIERQELEKINVTDDTVMEKQNNLKSLKKENAFAQTPS
ncbi:poly-gamma-glutamate synthase PgsB/CapB [Virgibacillus natechei]|uniref:Poly-gamma-glutamate synthase PgsB/CapB n=1 Tax=Virgibacillus natechei TaxID=1216297 RepID=A0ABS4IF23_9BACI|nr:poly-gamma-glutamate synthase PgsB [Virgibacillus natechei]MBP1969458.1 poly-gamma-glutamate synthase PgsB/CapB [Virgibacillus natechei]UZD11834.1 poly-gamma-glutamate synthase PgsB [Virgibacillus natechei]